jgi:hypothetical protein
VLRRLARSGNLRGPVSGTYLGAGRRIRLARRFHALRFIFSHRKLGQQRSAGSRSTLAKVTNGHDTYTMPFLIRRES